MSEPSIDTETAGLDGAPVQVVSFLLGSEEYGINIMMVQEIILPGRITQVPEAPKFLLGVINLRGNVIPVVNLRCRFGMPETEATEETRIVVVDLEGRTIGIVVDAVSEVLNILPEQISPAPPCISSPGTEYLQGLARLKDRLLILLDMTKILGDDSEIAIPRELTQA